MKRPLKKFVAVVAAVAIGLSGALLAASPAQAHGGPSETKQGGGPTPGFSSEFDCVDGKWVITWTLSARDDTKRKVSEIRMQKPGQGQGGNPWNSVELDGDLRVDEILQQGSQTYPSELSGTYVLDGDFSGMVKLQVRTDWWHQHRGWRTGGISPDNSVKISGECKADETGESQPWSYAKSTCEFIKVKVANGPRATANSSFELRVDGETRQSGELTPGEWEYFKFYEGEAVEVYFDGELYDSYEWNPEAWCFPGDYEVTSGCFNWIANLWVPEYGETTTWTFTDNTGASTEVTLSPGEEFYDEVLAVAGDNPSLTVTQDPNGETATYEYDQPADCFKEAEFELVEGANCEGVFFYAHNSSQDGVDLNFEFVPSAGEAKTVVLAAGEYRDAEDPITFTADADGFTVDLTVTPVEGEFEDGPVTFTSAAWASDQKGCADAPGKGDGETDDASRLPVTGTSMMIATGSAAALLLAGALLFLLMRRRHTAQNWE
ncbi:LPXTG cell wall anchor domain-containing protein [Natronoglycomyces albus]|uniref:LPXTG cell wall anchor domain-containing protein n=1 Tax=Natronoglycomyces albus TaxID=2811108 RepID=A0A895XQY8_9ACTN|nr:LPXTG cell wall anchor domain-containing protein [Natronoglycomyces albus]QSB06132.1 LPXTG cell wall anchor domain-containing protein [Natronoglycomyces albus]